MHRVGMKGWVVPSIILAGILTRWTIGMGSYSGYASPPMFGDYEAQRHWMEITLHLPISEWYRYDLQYWGLDYPPLTAYVSWLCGAVGSLIEPSWFTLDESRGIETKGSKLFMRATVLAFDYLIYVPALWWFTRTCLAGRSKRTQNFALVTLLFQPALLLIDFGHFQYNSVMLGFAVLAINCFFSGRDTLGAFFYVCSLCFKQMALYYAPAVGMYLIGKCIYLGPSEGTKLLIRLSLVTSLSFLLLFLPFLPPFASLSSILDPITRIFPFNRGIFEDKVANFWCASNVVFKWRLWASRDTLVRLSALLTVLGFLGAAIAPVKAWLRLRSSLSDTISGTPSVMQPVLLYALLNSSLSFFLFSFQVHEKTILLPLLPLSLLLSGAAADSTTFSLGVLCNNIAVFSIWPLLKRDGLVVQYFALLVLWNRMIGYNPLQRPLAMVRMFHPSIVYVACFAVHIAELVIPPPSRYPDIYPVLNVLVSTPVFGLTWLWSIKSIIEARWAVGGLSVSTGGANLQHDGTPAVLTPATEDDGTELSALSLKGMGHHRCLR
ncbi:glucosyltransferase [Vararia minispora EC-137]|uniref:Glucosyltransferase n=1 Tax=Vararia minispora EC-137 TaxID=1314806 RepID=A0ACB8QY20_9AGAM|nr:glucosyltransferase [Vararia minispora EC-137]